MTNGQKAGTAAAGLLSVFALLLASQSLPVMQWVLGEIKVFASLPLFAPTVLAMCVGAGFSAWMPHMLPPTWPAHRTKRITRLLAAGISFVMVAAQYRSAIGVQYGLFAAMGGYVLWTMVAGFVYRNFPDVAPPSLTDENGDTHAP